MLHIESLYHHKSTVALEPVLNDWKEFLRRLLSSFCTRAEGDVVSTSKAIVPAAREPETRVGLLIPLTLNYSFRVKSPVYGPGMTEYPFEANLTTLVSSLFKLVIGFSFHHSSFSGVCSQRDLNEPFFWARILFLLTTQDRSIFRVILSLREEYRQERRSRVSSLFFLHAVWK